MDDWRALVGAAFPMHCPGCGQRAEPVCEACARAMRAAPAAPSPPGVDRWLAPFAYEGTARELIARVKYRRAHAAVPWLAGRMAALVRATALHQQLELVTWAPTTRARRNARGFDHAEMLGRAVASALGLPARATLRRASGSPQTGREAAARRAGPRFVARRRPLPAGVLLVDDVGTTGATIAAAAAALRLAGADRVIAATAARTPPPRGLRSEAPGGAGRDAAYTRAMAAGSRRNAAAIGMR